MKITKKNLSIMENLKLIHQLFVGKVADEIGMERAIQLLEEAKEAFPAHIRNLRNEELLDAMKDRIENP